MTFQRTPSDVHLDEIHDNDELVGFFNSVPRQQILLSLKSFIDSLINTSIKGVPMILQCV